MPIQRLISRWTFDEQSRLATALSNSKLRLNNDKPHLPLGLTLALPYTTDLDAVGRTPERRLNGLLQLQGFDEDADIPAGTSIKYRLRVGPGGSPIYWSGAAWVAATLDTHWNSAQAVNDNLGSLLLTSKTLSVDANLRSSDGAQTPFLRSIGFLGRFSIDWWDDLIYDTMVRSMRESLRATTDVEFEVASTTSLINLANEYKLTNTGYNFTGVVLAYNLTTDPLKLNNIASSYTPGAGRPDGTTENGQITLTTPVPTGNILRVTMEYEPEIAVNTNQDYYEPARLPALVFERITELNIRDGSGRSDGITDGEVYKNKAAYTGVVVPNPRQFSIRIDYATIAQLGMDEARLATAIEHWVVNHRVLRTWALDEEIHIDNERGIERKGSSTMDDIRSSTGALIVRGIAFWLRNATDVSLVQNFNVDLINTPPQTVDE